MQFVIISGMSGAGKSKAASDLEDLGFYCVDNMPAEMIPQFAQLCLATKGRYEKVALVTDIRASMTFDALFQALQKLDDMHLQYSIYYIEASTAVIIKRYKETRRLHPLMKDGSTLENAIARELTHEPHIEKPLTSTTRPRREGESEGDYRFLTKKEFLKEAEAGRYLETTVYSGHYFGTGAEEIDRIVSRGHVAVIPIDICGALTLKNRYREQALLVFLDRSRTAVIHEIVTRDLDAKDKTCRILSLDDEYRNEQLCDLTVRADGTAKETAAKIREAAKI